MQLQTAVIFKGFQPQLGFYLHWNGVQQKLLTLSSFWDDISVSIGKEGTWHRSKTPSGSWGSGCFSVPLPSHVGRGTPVLNGENSTFALRLSSEDELLQTSSSFCPALTTAQKLEWSLISSLSPRYGCFHSHSVPASQGSVTAWRSSCIQMRILISGLCSPWKWAVLPAGHKHTGCSGCYQHLRADWLSFAGN